MRLPTISHFGACPHCHEDGYYLNIGRDHWFICDEHKVAWCVGSNLFSSWQSEAKEDWERNRKKLKDGYRPLASGEGSSWSWQEAPPLRNLYRWWARDWLRMLANRSGLVGKWILARRYGGVPF